VRLDARKQTCSAFSFWKRQGRSSAEKAHWPNPNCRMLQNEAVPRTDAASMISTPSDRQQPLSGRCLECGELRMVVLASMPKEALNWSTVQQCQNGENS